MPRRASWVAIAVLAVAGLGTSAPAQPRRGGDPAAVADRREAVKKKIRAMRAYLLTEELELDERGAARLFPVLARYDDETDKLLERRLDIQDRLRRIHPARDAKAAERAIDDAIANQREFWELEDRRIAELRKILTPGQTARLLVVLPDLERRIRNQLSRAIGRGAAGRPRPAVGDDELDDDSQLEERVPPPTRPGVRRP